MFTFHTQDYPADQGPDSPLRCMGQLPARIVEVRPAHIMCMYADCRHDCTFGRESTTLLVRSYQDVTTSSVRTRAAFKRELLNHHYVFYLTTGCCYAHDLRDCRVLLKSRPTCARGQSTMAAWSTWDFKDGSTSITCGAWLAKVTEQAIGFRHHRPAPMASMPMPVRSTLGCECYDFRHGSRLTIEQIWPDLVSWRGRAAKTGPTVLRQSR